MSKPVVSIANLDNKSAAEVIVDYAGDFFATITLEDIPNILKEIIDNLKSVGKQVMNKIKDFVLNDLWGLIIDTKNIIKSLLNQQLDKAFSCASRAMDKLEKVLDVLSYIPCLSVVIGVILIVVYICQLDFISVASAAICMLGPLKILTKIFPKSRNVINKLVEFLVDFGKRFKDQAKTSLRTLVRKSKVSSIGETPKNYNNHRLLEITEKKVETPQSIDNVSTVKKTDVTLKDDATDSDYNIVKIQKELREAGQYSHLKRMTSNIGEKSTSKTGYIVGVGSTHNNINLPGYIVGVGSTHNNKNLLGRNLIRGLGEMK